MANTTARSLIGIDDPARVRGLILRRPARAARIDSVRQTRLGPRRNEGDGRQPRTLRCTRVYCREDSGWKIAYATPVNSSAEETTAMTARYTRR